MIATFIYPFIFSLFPVLSLYINNFNEVEFSEVLCTCLLLLFYTACIFIGSLIVLREVQKTSLITFIFLFFIFSYGPYIFLFQQVLSHKELLNLYPTFISLWIIVFLLSISITILTNKKLKIINDFFLLLSLFLITTSLIRLFIKKPQRNINVVYNQKTEAEFILPQKPVNSTDLPDIYFIVTDRYLGNDLLKKNYSFDNDDFLDFLRSRGFYVIEKGRSNYLKTAHSLASSLNMEYINYLSGDIGEGSSNWMPLYGLIEKNKVAKALITAGYEYIFLGSWWEPTRKSDIADINVNIHVMSEFSTNLIKNTVFHPFYDQIFSTSIRKEQMDRSIYQVDYMKQIPSNMKPTFTFAHLMLTHPPYVFDEDGNFLNTKDFEKMTEKEIYVAQVKYVNKLLEDLVDEILSKSKTKPIIIIQSDEGKYPVDISHFDHLYDWFEAPEEKVEEKLSILNAIYLSGIDNGVLYETLTPVNTFRIVFNEIFDAGLDILPDETYLHQNNLNLYKFKKLE